MALADSNLPIVTIDYVYNGKMAVLSDNREGLAELVHYIYSQGHRRIAYIHGAPSSVSEARLVGFWRAVEELGLEIPEEYVREGVFHDPADTAKQTAALLDLPQPPTCILFPDDFSAIGGINEIRSRGLSIPGDLSVAGYDGIHLSQVMDPPLTTIRQQTQIMLGINPSLYEAADIDGATGWQKYKRITLPLLRPIMIVFTGAKTLSNSSRKRTLAPRQV